ncbi:MAG: hypothetical protein GF398_11555 [Chitinivibrionales bacterium]|nr:hypothetical protein [Chitinivibrionales bacterium]
MPTSKRNVTVFLLSLFAIHVSLPAAARPEPGADSLSSKFSLSLNGSYKILHGNLAESWNNYFAGGLEARFATHHNKYYLSTTFDFGRIDGKAQLDKSHFIMQLGVLMERKIFIADNITLYPVLGVISTAINLQPFDHITTLDIIATWENEFGFQAGLSAGVGFGKYFIAIPLRFGWTFSQPERLLNTAISFCFGRDF